MKKLICALLSLALGLSLAACSNWSVEIKKPEDLSTGSAEESESSPSEDCESTAPFEVKEVIISKDFLGETFLEKYGFDLAFCIWSIFRLIINLKILFCKGSFKTIDNCLFFKNPFCIFFFKK